MKLGFVFTNYNNVKFTLNAVKSVNEIISCETKIVIVDNGSNHDARRILENIDDSYENVFIIYNEENIGYFNGLNVGLKFLVNHYPEYRYLVIGNNDVLFPTDFAQKISKKIDLFDQYPVISPGIYTLDGEPQNPHVISKISLLREIVYDLYHSSYFLAKLITKLAGLTHRFTDRKDENSHEIAQEIYQGYGAMYILGPKFFEYFDQLWAPTFLMYEEYFLSKQLKDIGFKLYYEPSITLTHLMHATTSQLPGKMKWEFSANSHKVYRRYVKPWSSKG